jgi:hypothetical protein
VHEVGVGGHGEDFHAQLLQFVVMVGHVAQFGGAHEGEVSGVEEEHGPLPRTSFSVTSMNLPFLKACVLKGLIWVLITDIAVSFVVGE